jgi:hypothetical protein
MKNIKSIEEFLFESKQVGVLYHYTSFKGLLGIIKTDSLLGHISNNFEFNFDVDNFEFETDDYELEKLQNYYNQRRDKFENQYKISFTRDKNFTNIQRTIGKDLSVRLVVDGDKLSNNYKIEPYQYQAHYGKSISKLGDEAEEKVFIKKGDKLENISKYLIKIEFKKTWLKWKPWLLNSSETFYNFLGEMGVEDFKDLSNYEYDANIYYSKRDYYKDGILELIEKNRKEIERVLGCEFGYY